MSLRPIFLHLQSGAGMENRFDTLMMVNGSIAACCTIAAQYGYTPLAIDEAYPGPAYLQTNVREEIELALRHNQTPVIFCTVLSYNAEGSIKLLKELKAEYGSRIRVGVGGQLIRTAPQAYLRYQEEGWLDHIGIGDAEVVLPKLLAGVPVAQGYLFGNFTQLDNAHYAPLSYDYYAGIEQRLDEMQHMPSFGPLTNVRQLVTESVRGCAWAYKHGTCEFCSLEGIDTKPSFKPLAQHFQIQRDLVERYNLNWLFDVSNQWLPTYGKDAEAWLEQYNAARIRFNAPPVNVYTYLTANSLTSRTAPLLRAAGIRCAYVGIDGWNTETWQAHGKAQSVFAALKAAKQTGIAIRASVVIGDGLDRETLTDLPAFVTSLLQEYGDNILTLGVFMEIILQGSPVWRKFERIARQEDIREAVALYDKMARLGFLTWDDEVQLTRLYIDHTQSVSANEAELVRDVTVKIVEQSGKVVPTTIEQGGKFPARTTQ